MEVIVRQFKLEYDPIMYFFTYFLVFCKGLASGAFWTVKEKKNAFVFF